MTTREEGAEDEKREASLEEDSPERERRGREWIPLIRRKSRSQKLENYAQLQINLV